MKRIAFFLAVVSAVWAAAQAPADFDRFLDTQNKAFMQAWEQKDWARGLAIMQDLERRPEIAMHSDARSLVLYNLACAYARNNNPKQAMLALRRAADSGFNNYRQITRDSDLEPVRSDKNFWKLVDDLRARHQLLWAREKPAVPRLVISDPRQAELLQLRTAYQLDGVLAGSADEYERLQRLVLWAHQRFEHDGGNDAAPADPLAILREAAAGKKFRCVEYATVLAAAAQSLGIPARVLGLQRSDVETRSSGAGHVVTEIWSRQFNKWVLADAQFGLIAERNGTPMNAVEFQEAIAGEKTGVECKNAWSGSECSQWQDFLLPYLYYFDYGADQRFYTTKEKNFIMLVPKGARQPALFQGKPWFSDSRCIYISDPEAFYQPPA